MTPKLWTAIRTATFVSIPTLGVAPRSGAVIGLPRPVCPADCNGDGEVTVVEMQRCVNIYLGDQSIDVCLSCSSDGDDEVGIVDLQAMINCWLGLPVLQ